MEFRWPRLMIEGLGPIRQAKLTIKPLTIIIGRNSFGKSLLINLAYLLSSTLPSFPKLKELVGDRALKLAESALTAIKEDRVEDASRELTGLLHLHLQEVGPALGMSLTSRFKEFFNVEKVVELFRGQALIEGSRLLKCFIKPSDDYLEVKVEGYHEVEAAIESVERGPEGFFVQVNLTCRGENWVEEPWGWYVEDAGDVLSLTGNRLLPSVLTDLAPLSFATIDPYLLTDSRAGVLRLARASLSRSLEYGRLTVPAREAAFLAAYDKLMRRFYERKVKEDLRGAYNNFMAEIGVDDVRIRLVGGYPEAVVKDCWGREMLLEECPSGIREALSIALALAVESEGFEALFVEEAEAHLHPKALDRMLRLAWGALQAEKRVLYLIVTTHSPIVLSVVNNLVMSLKEGYEVVSVVHLREIEGGVESEEIEVSEEGFDESELSAIFVELMEERARLG
ncbi:MAG: hypothetical protein DRJ69_04125 [Thermoprotei archaeon]|nr:MAG: hypothetical protein DRJ69_04125 [Thermoprotei archaeon]